MQVKNFRVYVCSSRFIYTRIHTLHCCDSKHALVAYKNIFYCRVTAGAGRAAKYILNVYKNIYVYKSLHA